MRKVSLMIAALALVLGISQCKKQEKPVANGQKQHIELTANNGNGGSKVSGSISGADFDLSWQEGDVINVSGGATSDEPLELSSGAGTTSATFGGEITKVSDDDILFTVGSIDYMLQEGTAEWIEDNVKLEGKSEFKEDGKYSVDMELPYAVLMLDLSAFASNAKDGGVVVTIKSGTTELASVKGITADSKAVYVAMPVVAGSTKYTLVGNGKIAEKTWELAANTFFTAADEQGHPTGQAFVIEAVPAIPTGALSDKKFTVGEGKQVYFSKGNLYWNGSSFEIEPNQYNYTNTWDASYVTHFFWSSYADKAYGISNSSMTGTGGDVFFTNDEEVFVANNERGWYTLSQSEWKYLLQSRTNANSLKSYYLNTTIKIENKNYRGIFIYPDGYNGNTVGGEGVATWAAINEAGIVFLPYAGRRNDNGNFSDFNSFHYWSSTPDATKNAYYLYMSTTDPVVSASRAYGSSVRLVYNAN